LAKSIFRQNYNFYDYNEMGCVFTSTANTITQLMEKEKKNYYFNFTLDLLVRHTGVLKIKGHHETCLYYFFAGVSFSRLFIFEFVRN